MDTTTQKLNYLSMTGIDLGEENRLGIELINGEIGTIDTEIENLTSDLATEISDRTSGDTTLANDLSFETTSRVAQDSILSVSIGEVEADLATETTSRVAEDAILLSNITTVSNSLTTETTTRTNADNNLQSQIDDVESDLSAETTSRVAEDASLLSSIGDVEDDLTNEITTRTNADSTLQTQIDDIKTGVVGDNIVHVDAVETIIGAKTFTQKLNIHKPYSATAGANTLSLYQDNDYGFGIDAFTLKYLSLRDHKFYSGSTATNNGTEKLTIGDTTTTLINDTICAHNSSAIASYLQTGGVHSTVSLGNTPFYPQIRSFRRDVGYSDRTDLQF